jgi:nicotinamide-nucleotide amidase
VTAGDGQSALHRLAARVLDQLAATQATLATAESLTGGLLAATITSVPGASGCYRGGIVAYATDVKHRLLDVPEEVLHAHGAVSAETAEAMAAGARERLDSTYGLATTGVAGPDPQEGKPVGLVYVAVAGPRGNSSGRHHFTGKRAVVRADAVAAVLNLLLSEHGRSNWGADENRDPWR